MGVKFEQWGKSGLCLIEFIQMVENISDKMSGMTAINPPTMSDKTRHISGEICK
jgi:hypothetical protein